MEALALRTLHLVAAAVLVGVPFLAAGSDRSARRAEWLFWPAVAVVVLGGMANLGALGAVPAPSGHRGMILTAKIVTLLVLLLVSLARLGRTVVGRPATGLWAVSGGLALVAMVLAVVLAHG